MPIGTAARVVVDAAPPAGGAAWAEAARQESASRNTRQVIDKPGGVFAAFIVVPLPLAFQGLVMQVSSVR